MEIEKISLSGFANLGMVDLDLGQITYLISKNNVGKSNIMKAIDLGALFLNSGGCALPAESYSFEQYASALKRGFHDPFSLAIQGKTKISDKAYLFKYNFVFGWPLEEKTGFFGTESLAVKEEGAPKYTTVFSRQEGKGSYQKKIDSHSTIDTTVDSDTLLLHKMTFLDGIEYLSLLKEISSLNVLIDDGFDGNFMLSMNFMIRHANFMPFSRGSLLPQMIYEIKEKNFDSYQKILNTMKDLFPSLLDFDPQRAPVPKDAGKMSKNSPDNYFLYLREKGLVTALALDEMSDGFRRILSSLVFLEEADDSDCSILCFEEPENCINPALLRNYLTALTSFANKNKIIISSHSPFLASYVNPSSIYVGIQDEEGVSNFSSFKQNGVSHLMKVASENEYTFGEYIFNLLAGDDSDLAALKKALVK